MSERWLPVVGYEGLYDVSDMGRVRSLDRVLNDGRNWPGRILKPLMNKDRPYPHVALRIAGHRVDKYIHQLVLETFVGSRPIGLEACHLNDIPADCRLTNLRWDTQSANRRDRIRNGKDYNVNKTKCPKGHPYNKEHTLFTKEGWRYCKTCVNERRRTARAAKTCSAQ
jgi:hypothetical protein